MQENSQTASHDWSKPVALSGTEDPSLCLMKGIKSPDFKEHSLLLLVKYCCALQDPRLAREFAFFLELLIQESARGTHTHTHSRDVCKREDANDDFRRDSKRKRKKSVSRRSPLSDHAIESCELVKVYSKRSNRIKIKEKVRHNTHTHYERDDRIGKVSDIGAVTMSQRRHFVSFSSRL